MRNGVVMTHQMLPWHCYSQSFQFVLNVSLILQYTGAKTAEAGDQEGRKGDGNSAGGVGCGGHFRQAAVGNH